VLSRSLGLQACPSAPARADNRSHLRSTRWLGAQQRPVCRSPVVLAPRDVGLPQADSDGNPDTDADPTWTPLLKVNHLPLIDTPRHHFASPGGEAERSVFVRGDSDEPRVDGRVNPALQHRHMLVAQ